ncbi:UDP-N-acetylglucosamine 2-epimerase [Gracilibacillus marinus]|uniref:UDP-N-acetylglucosamine 2-epimerase n=1 Tax=Gracilibacillus marinus TaxID=630535 RepID=A0ABV8VQ16_9BACI
MTKKICVVTGTRAEYGLLYPLMKRIQADLNLELQIIATGMHLSPEFGSTYHQIEEDGFHVNDKVEILLSSDSGIGICKSMGLATISISESLARLSPDLLIILGDRFEMLSIASVASVLKIPIAHLHGGETTEGAFDEAFRHSITKMSYLHFTSTDTYRNRVIQLGENPDRVYNVGAIGIENIKTLSLLSKEKLEESIQFELDKQFALVTFHPVTLENSTTVQQFTNLLEAIDQLKDWKFIFTKANADTDGRSINELIDQYVTRNKDRVIAFDSMGQLRYLSAMKYCHLVIGNSSSGILEAPSFHVPTINIGDRQKGRIQADSVYNCKPEKEDILHTIKQATSVEVSKKIQKVNSPYGEGNVSEKILEAIHFHFKKGIEIKKQFYDIESEDSI